MKLYKLPTAPAGERWHSAKTGLKDYEEIELPKDGRAGMAALFNASEKEVGTPQLVFRDDLSNEHPAWQRLNNLDPLEAAELRTVAASRSGATVAHEQRPVSATDIERFIRADASIEQVEDIFAALGARLKEHIDGA